MAFSVRPSSTPPGFQLTIRSEFREVSGGGADTGEGVIGSMSRRVDVEGGEFRDKKFWSESFRRGGAIQWPNKGGSTKNLDGQDVKLRYFIRRLSPSRENSMSFFKPGKSIFEGDNRQVPPVVGGVPYFRRKSAREVDFEELGVLVPETVDVLSTATEPFDHQIFYTPS